MLLQKDVRSHGCLACFDGMLHQFSSRLTKAKSVR